MEMLLPLVSSFVNDVVLHVSEMALQVVHMLDFHLIDSILIYAPDFVVNWVWVWASNHASFRWNATLSVQRGRQDTRRWDEWLKMSIWTGHSVCTLSKKRQMLSCAAAQVDQSILASTGSHGSCIGCSVQISVAWNCWHCVSDLSVIFTSVGTAQARWGPCITRTLAGLYFGHQCTVLLVRQRISAYANGCCHLPQWSLPLNCSALWTACGVRAHRLEQHLLSPCDHPDGIRMPLTKYLADLLKTMAMLRA